MTSLEKRTFFHDMGYTPHPGQLEVHTSNAPRRVLACGVRFGKSKAAAMEGLAAAIQPRASSVGWIVAPNYDLASRVFNQLTQVACNKLRHLIVEMKESERLLRIINLGGGISEIRAKSAESPQSLLGEGLNWVIVDEAAQLQPRIWESYVSQRLIDHKGWALLISTPHGRGWFYDEYKRGQGRDPDYRSWNLPSWMNPMLDREQIELERNRIPERVFRQEYGAEFLEGAGQVFRNVRDLAVLDWQAPKSGERYVAGLDLAKVEDYTVLVILNRKLEVVFVDRFHRIDWDVQVNRVREACRRYGNPRMLCDTTGVGEPLYDSLIKRGCNAVPYPFTARSKTDLINHLSLLFEQRTIRLPKADLWPEGIDELESFEYSVSDNNNVRTSAPSGAHDDCVIALSLAAWLTRQAHATLTIYDLSKHGQLKPVYSR